jgi:hypothetical protein
MRRLLSLLSLATLCMGSHDQQLEARQTPATQYIIFNNCPTAVPLYIAGDLHGVIPFQGNTTKFLSGDVPFINTNANGGTFNSTGTLRAGFKANVSTYLLNFLSEPDSMAITGTLLLPRQGP